ncbi:MAG TPA: ABC transporter permease subunit [Gaiellaceae bacterium]|nr:ABC transporter permease subunit [Gaiellaceae bacterium]
MIWVGWRQQRVETAIAAAMLVLLAAIAIPVGIHMGSVYAHQGLSACTGATKEQPGPCNPLVGAFVTRFSGVNVLFTLATLLPAVAALLFAAPFVLDLDNGTYRLLWTQSITRRRWVVGKLGLSVAASVAVAGCLIALATWTRAPLDQLNGRMDANTYDVSGIAPIAYALFVLGVAVAIGALWRRTVPALLVAFVVYVVGRAVMDSWLRQRLLAPIKATWAFGKSGAPNLQHALVIDQFISDRHGHRLASALVKCGQSSGGLLTHTRQLCAAPVPAGGRSYMTAIYQPASRFWDLQGVEFALVGGIGVLLVLFAAWWTQRRVA